MAIEQLYSFIFLGYKGHKGILNHIFITFPFKINELEISYVEFNITVNFAAAFIMAFK